VRETKKNHQRNSCNKNQSERREKAPRGAPAGRHPPPHTYTRYIASTLPRRRRYLLIFIIRNLPNQKVTFVLVRCYSPFGKCASETRLLVGTVGRQRQAAGGSRERRGRFLAKRRLFLFLRRGKKSARARPAPPKHAPRSDADSGGCVPNSLSFATSHRLPKVTVQRACSAAACGALR
jgi:hypothetical protein